MVILGHMGRIGFRNSLREKTLEHLLAAGSNRNGLGSQMGLSLNSGLINLPELQNLHL